MITLDRLPGRSPALLFLLWSGAAFAQAPAIDRDDIGGVVTSANGPEAGVWVIAETDDFDTRFARIVATDDRGRYVVPDLPPGTYQLWVRGYGLVDSGKTAAQPGATVNLAATTAPNAAAAARVYPAIYWYSMMKVPEASELANLPGGVPQYLASMRNLSCVGCHQLGQWSTRTIPSAFATEFGHGRDAWVRRIQSGQAGQQMLGAAMNQLGGVPVKYLGEWTERVHAGELPHATPERPRGVERNIVATVRDWSTEKAYMHDLSGTDRRDPTVNAYGKLYGAPELSTDEFPILDPMGNTATVLHAPVQDPSTPTTNSTPPLQPSAYWGDEAIWDSKANAHNPMLDERGRVWYTAVVRAPANAPAYCSAESNHPSAKLLPLPRSGRQMSMYDPKTEKYTFIDTCFSTHHLQFDAQGRIWTSGGGPAVGWLDSKVFDETGDALKSQGWSPFVLDTNGNGKRDEYVEPDKPLDPAKDKRITGGSGPYAVMPSPVDGTIWYTVGTFAGAPGFLRFDPATGLSEMFNLPKKGYGIRGGDIDKNGVVWGSASNGSLVSFDRRKCKGPLNGPKATGDHCPEGFTFYRYPGPGFAGEKTSAEASYYTWVDQHNTFGLGENIPMSTANLNDGFVALKDGKMVTIRIPYPMGFYAKGFDGRIDDPAGGWKGRGLWSTSGDRTPWLMEGGKGSKPRAVHIQLRPDPLAR